MRNALLSQQKIYKKALSMLFECVHLRLSAHPAAIFAFWSCVRFNQTSDWQPGRKPWISICVPLPHYSMVQLSLWGPGVKMVTAILHSGCVAAGSTIPQLHAAYPLEVQNILLHLTCCFSQYLPYEQHQFCSFAPVWPQLYNFFLTA